MHFKLLFLIVLHSAVCSFITGDEDKGNVCKPTRITCGCGPGRRKTYAHLDVEMVPSSTDKQKCEFKQTPSSACRRIHCEYDTDLPGNHLCSLDEARTLKNATIKCYKWNDWMNCDIKCIHGHAFTNADDFMTEKNVNCRYTENVWKSPQRQIFEDCSPYFDCWVQLVSEGDMTCIKSPSHDVPFMCNITCFEDDPLKHKMYACVDENGFNDTLPSCAVAVKRDVPLLKKPNLPLSPKRETGDDHLSPEIFQERHPLSETDAHVEK